MGKNIKDFGPLFLRIALAAIFIYHGSQKLFGIFDGPGIKGTASMFSYLGLEPATILAIMTGVVEFAGGICCLVGIFTRIAVVALTGIMFIAIVYVHGKNGFNLMNGGFEYNFAIICMCASLMISGAGPMSIDEKL
ncbi:MAG: DoxX family protein [Planctomycetes bacterium]|nr:DoxX family protein [Planctomycetota bacterium]